MVVVKWSACRTTKGNVAYFKLIVGTLSRKMLFLLDDQVDQVSLVKQGIAPNYLFCKIGGFLARLLEGKIDKIIVIAGPR